LAVELDGDVVLIRANRAYARLPSGDLPGAWDDWECAIQDGPRGRERNLDARRWPGEGVSDERLAGLAALRDELTQEERTHRRS